MSYILIAKAAGQKPLLLNNNLKEISSSDPEATLTADFPLGSIPSSLAFPACLFTWSKFCCYPLPGTLKVETSSSEKFLDLQNFMELEGFWFQPVWDQNDQGETVLNKCVWDSFVIGNFWCNNCLIILWIGSFSRLDHGNTSLAS